MQQRQRKAVYEHVGEIVAYDDGEALKKYIADNPTFDVNQTGVGSFMYRRTILHLAANNNCPECVAVLLEHPDIDPNIRDALSNTPLIYSCSNGNCDAARVLLKDKRSVVLSFVFFQMTDSLCSHRVTERIDCAMTGALESGNLSAAKMLVASGRPLEVDPKDVELARELGHPGRQDRINEVADFLERFLADEAGIRLEVQKELKWE